MNKIRILLAFLLISVLVLTACSNMPFSRTNSQNMNNRNYYTGTDGVVMRFSDVTAPPSRMYYFDGYSPEDNQFQVMVDVHNIGSSWTKGALFVSGYDPYMIRIEHIDIGRASTWSDCFTDVTSGLFNSFRVDCNGAFFEAGSNGFRFDIDSVGDLASSLGLSADLIPDFTRNLGISATSSDGSTEFGFNMDGIVEADYYNTGMTILLASSALSLTRFNGLNYKGLSAGPGLLAPDTLNYPGGEVGLVAFNAEIVNWPEGLDQTSKPISFLVTNCFFYTTIATPQVCIDPAPFDQGIKVCQPRRTTFNGGNGAPVAVTSIEQENTPRKVFFEINIANVGGGTVMDFGAMELCSPYNPSRLTSQHLNKVHIVDVRLGGQHLRCTPDRNTPIRLINGKGTVRCEYNMEYATAKSAYETPLIVELGYGYSTTMRRTSTIKRVA